MARKREADGEVRRRRLEQALGGLSTATPPEDTEAIQDLVVEHLDASQYAKELSTNWRSLLEESSTDPGTSGAFFFRPKSGLGLDPDEEDEAGARPGDVLDDFELLRLVATGGMGQVWEARQRTLDRNVALKLIRPKIMTPKAKRLFAIEGRAAGRLRHPGIVSVYAMGEAEGRHWIALEFVDGECTLADVLGQIRSPKQLPKDYDRRLAVFFYQLAEALAYAHSTGVVHRDLKPQNVLIAEGDHPKLADFGLARIEEEIAPEDQSPNAGTPRYMSPEQALGRSETQGPCSDVFSLGTMLYQALTLKLPFDGEDVEEVALAILEREPMPLRAHRPSIEPDLAAIVWRALRKRPEDRYPTMRALADDLAAYLDGRPVSARPVGLFERARKLVRRSPKMSAAVAGVVLLSVVALVLGRALGAALGSEREQRYEVQRLLATKAIDERDNDAVEAAVANMRELFPERVEGALLQAGSLALSSRFEEARDVLEDVEARGYDPRDASWFDAREQYHRGIHLMVVGGPASYEEAREAFDRAVELDPDFDEPWYPLYAVNRALNDRKAAWTALDRFTQKLAVGDEYLRVLRAVKLELNGQFEEALEALDELTREEDHDWERLRRLSFDKFHGRVLLLTHRYERAIGAFERYLETAPEDQDSWGNLALAYYARQRTAAFDEDETRRHLALAAQAAARARGYAFDKRSALQVLALVEDRRNYLDGTEKSAALEDLEAFDPEDALVRTLRGGRLIEEGYDAYEAQDWRSALSLLERGFALAPGRLGPVVILAQAAAFDPTRPDFGRARTLLDDAFSRWQHGAPRTEDFAVHFESGEYRDPNWVQGMLVTRHWVAVKTEDDEVEEETRLALEEYLAVEPFVKWENGLTYAEALVLAKDVEERHPDRAEELLQEFLEDGGYEEGGWPPSWDATIRALREGIAECR